jgi:hydroxylaminobenzene mutase
METSDVKRRLLRHGMLIVLLALLTGGAVPAFRNPRMALSAHVGGVMTGLLVAAIGLMWQELRLPSRTAAALYWTTLVAGWVNFGALILAAAFGTNSLTPFAGAGHAGAPWQEAIVFVTLTVGAIAVIAACALVLRGLRPRG